MVDAMAGTVKLGPEVWTIDLALIRPVTAAVEAYELLEALAAAGVPLERLDDAEPVQRSYSQETVEAISLPRRPSDLAES